jgi:hypothetical protein
MDGRVSGHLQIPTGQETERVHDAFHFYLNQLDPLNRAYQDGMAGENPQAFVDKIMLVLLTYYFVFTDIGNQQYNPTQDFETTVLDRLKRGTAEQKVDLLREFVTSLRTAPAVADAIIRLPIFFRALLRKRERPFLPQSAAYHLRVRRGLLEPKLSTVLQERSFFRRGILSGTYKQALKYIRLEDATFSADALCKLDADIHLDDVLFYPSTDPAESFSLAYEIGDTPALPVLLVPIDDQVVPVYERYFRDEHPIVIPYRLRKGKTRDEQRQFDADWIGNYGFLYRFVFSLLTFLSLQLLLALRPSLRSVNERVFLPIFRLHANPKQQPSREETFIRDFSIVCAHLLSERHLANHQGFYSTDLTALLARMPTQPPKGHPRCRCPHPSRVAFAMP